MAGKMRKGRRNSPMDKKADSKHKNMDGLQTQTHGLLFDPSTVGTSLHSENWENRWKLPLL